MGVAVHIDTTECVCYITIDGENLLFDLLCIFDQADHLITAGLLLGKLQSRTLGGTSPIFSLQWVNFLKCP